MSSGLKAGLIGAGVGLVLSLIGLIPFVGCCTGIIGLLVYAGVGVLAAYWLTPPRSAGAGAGAGAIAGLISGVGGSVVTTISAIVQGIMGTTTNAVSFIDPQIMQQLIDAGIDPDMFAMFAGVGGGILGGAMCCVGSLAIGAALGAIGGAIMAAAKPD
jgi:hypothetical protein